MKQQAVKRLVALAASLAIAGCAAPTLLKTPDSSRPAAATAAARDGAGKVELNVLWPDFRAYGTQAIPNRATKVVVSLKRTDGKPVLDLSGQPIEPITAQRGTYGYMDTYGKFSWELPQQQGVVITADLYAVDAVIATASRTIDVVAGLRSMISLDLVLAEAPTITSISTTSFRVGDIITLEGANFGTTGGWKAQVYLQEEYSHDGDDSPFEEDRSYNYNSPVYLPDAYVKVESDTKIVVTIPERINDNYRSGNLTDFFWGYFNGQNAKLTLGVNVDGVNSKRVEVAMPREVGGKATINLEQGFPAPAHRSDDQRYKELDLTDATFSTPVASGTEWVFEVGGNDYYYNRQKTTIRLTDSSGSAVIKQEWQYGMPYEQEVNFNYSGNYISPLIWEFQFLRRINAQGIDILGVENVTLPEGVTLPAGVEPKAKHLAYGDSSGTLYDLWVVPGVGPVKMRRLEVYGYKDQLWRNVREYRLVGFKPAGKN